MHWTEQDNITVAELRNIWAPFLHWSIFDLCSTIWNLQILEWSITKNHCPLKHLTVAKPNKRPKEKLAKKEWPQRWKSSRWEAVACPFAIQVGWWATSNPQWPVMLENRYKDQETCKLCLEWNDWHMDTYSPSATLCSFSWTKYSNIKASAAGHGSAIPSNLPKDRTVDLACS